MGADPRKHSEEGTGVGAVVGGGRKAFEALNQRARHTGGSALLRALEEMCGTCLRLSFRGKPGIYLSTPILSLPG